MAHIDKIELEQLLDGTLSFTRRMLVRRHLANCPDCKRLLESIRTDNEELDKVLAQLRRLDEADKQSSKSTGITVASLFRDSATEASH